MIYAIISDLHANLEALERVLDDASREGAEKVICLGDVVGYGPLPAETLALVRQTATIVLAGNHDDAVSGRINAEDFIDLASDAVKRHREVLSADDIAWLSARPYTATLGCAAFAHGDIADPPAFNYLNSRDEAAANFAATDAQILFVGHTHVPLMHLVGPSGEVYRIEPQDFSAEDGKRYIVNVGSVGYPREADGQCQSCYVLYDTDMKSVRFRYLPFSVASLLQRGTTPSWRKPWILAGLATFLALGGTTTYLALRPKPEATVVEVSAETPVFAEQRLFFTPSKHAVKANLRLQRGSVPVFLTISFQDDHQHEIDAETNVVAQSSRKKFAIPAKATNALFSLRTTVPGQTPTVDGFAPSAD